MRQRVGLLICAALVLLPACGGGGGPPAAPPIATAADNYFPLDANARWLISSDGLQEPTVASVVGTQAVAGGMGTVVSTRYGFVGRLTRSVYVATSGGIRKHVDTGADLLERAFDGIELFRLPAYVGDTFEQIDKTVDAGEDLDADGRPDSLKVRSTWTAVARETVTTAAGIFTNSFHTRQVAHIVVSYSTGNTPLNIDITTDTWYAPNVGPVKSTTIVGGGLPPTTSTDLLLAYRVGSVNSDRVAPTIQATSPGAAPVPGAYSAASVTFSEAMDAASFTPGTFTVTDSLNAPVAGTARVYDSMVVFVPTQAWASGTYTAHISGSVSDLLGNPLGTPRSWAFTIDASTPRLLRMSPPDGSAQVPLDSAIVLEFSEPVSPGSVTLESILVFDGNGETPGLLTVDGARVTFTPSARLHRGSAYTIGISGVTDLAGNIMDSAVYWRFNTTQGAATSPAPFGTGLARREPAATAWRAAGASGRRAMVVGAADWVP